MSSQAVTLLRRAVRCDVQSLRQLLFWRLQWSPVGPFQRHGGRCAEDAFSAGKSASCGASSILMKGFSAKRTGPENRFPGTLFGSWVLCCLTAALYQMLVQHTVRAG